MTKEEIISLAIMIIVAAFIIFPAFQNFSSNVMNGFNNWYSDRMADNIFLDESNAEYQHSDYTEIY